jgi:hypothetical protein
MSWRKAVIGLALTGWGLAACAPAPVEEPQPAPVAAPAPPPPRDQPLRAPSTQSAELAAFYARLQAQMLKQDLLRSDGGGPDTPFTDTMLARNFVQIALATEYRDDSDFTIPDQRQSTLRRWEQPIRMQVRVSDTVAPAEADEIRASVAAYAGRLSRLTGVPISQTDARPNFHVLFLDEDDRRAAGPLLRSLVPAMSEQTLRGIVDLPRDQLCLVAGVFAPGGSSYEQAIVVIRAEHPRLIRSACIHEELAQGMGLANDSDAARPSIFNDSEEFALLTRHDAMLLRMLYDPRLTPGMTPATAAPIARIIAQELMAEAGSS